MVQRGAVAVALAVERTVDPGPDELADLGEGGERHQDADVTRRTARIEQAVDGTRDQAETDAPAAERQVLRQPGRDCGCR